MSGHQKPTARRLPAFDQGDVVKVPSSYTDRSTRQYRLALVASTRDLESAHGLLWVLMITSAEDRRWPGEVAVPQPDAAGLPAPSVIRTAKVATIDAKDATRLGRLPPRLLRQGLDAVPRTLGA